MFKRVLESLSKSLGGKPALPKPAPPAPQKSAPAAPPAPSKQGGVLDKVAAAKPAPARAPEKKVPASPEELCGISAKMTKDEIGTRLKLLYRRYNRGASSLDQKVRHEADMMLDAIVAVREKTFGEL